MAIAAFVARGTSSDADYLVAGRRLGVWAVGLSLFATWFAAESVVATTAEVAANGLAGARIEPFAYGLGILLLGLIVAGRLRKGGYITVADFMGDRFGGRTESLSAVAIAVSAMVWASAQLFALATLISSSSEMTFTAALVASTAVVLIYTLVGGLMGDVATDMIQGVILAAGVGVLLFLAIDAGCEVSGHRPARGASGRREGRRCCPAWLPMGSRPWARASGTWSRRPASSPDPMPWPW